MTSTKFAGRGGVMTKIAVHAIGHEQTGDGTLLRVDYERGAGWSPRVAPWTPKREKAIMLEGQSC